MFSMVFFLILNFRWNDRDCNEKNFFLCERPLSDGKYPVCSFRTQQDKSNKAKKKKSHFITDDLLSIFVS